MCTFKKVDAPHKQKSFIDTIRRQGQSASDRRLIARPSAVETGVYRSVPSSAQGSGKKETKRRQIFAKAGRPLLFKSAKVTFRGESTTTILNQQQH